MLPPLHRISITAQTAQCAVCRVRFVIVPIACLCLYSHHTPVCSGMSVLLLFNNGNDLFVQMN